MATIAVKNIDGIASGNGSTSDPEILIDESDLPVAITAVIHKETSPPPSSRVAFLKSLLAALSAFLQAQYNIMILTPSPKDIEWGGPLKGKVSGLEPLEVEIDGDKAEFKVLVFEEGKYLRKGKSDDGNFVYAPETAHAKKNVNVQIEFVKQQKKKTEGVPRAEDLKKKSMTYGVNGKHEDPDEDEDEEDDEEDEEEYDEDEDADEGSEDGEEYDEDEASQEEEDDEEGDEDGVSELDEDEDAGIGSEDEGVSDLDEEDETEGKSPTGPERERERAPN
jgi:hypothetical protein